MVNLMINGATGWQVADLGKDAQVALTFEESSIAEASFKCSGSIEFDLPATTKNRAIFGNINDRQTRRGRCCFCDRIPDPAGLRQCLHVVHTEERR